MTLTHFAMRVLAGSLLLGFLGLGAVRVGAEDKGDTPAKALGPRAEGRRMLASLPPIQPSAVHESYFELSMHGETTGYVISSLAPLQEKHAPLQDKLAPIHDKSEMRYAYDDLCVIQGPTGAGTEMRTTGQLDRHCMPLTLTWETTHRLPIGAKATTRESMTVDAKQLTYSTEGGKEPAPVTVNRPTGPFVHPISRLMSLLKPQAGQFFMLREFDTEAKAFAWRSYRVTKKEDGRLRIAVGDSRGLNEEAYYILDADGEVAQHGSAGLPFLFKRCTKQRVEAIKKELADKAKAKPDSAKRPTATKPAR